MNDCIGGGRAVLSGSGGRKRALFMTHRPCGKVSIYSESSVDTATHAWDTSIMDPAPKALLEAQDRFIAVWGQMAGAWGISRTMAEVHALLYITGEPLCTDDIMERLEISRGNASMSLRALLDW